MASPLFNIDLTVNVTADIEEGTESRVRNLRYKDSERSMADLLEPNRYSNVCKAISCIIEEPLAMAAQTVCGVIVHRDWI